MTIRVADSLNPTRQAPAESFLQSRKFPGGSLLSAVLDRTVMGLADRGGASGLIGARWADHCADFVSDWAGAPRQTPDGELFTVERIVRLDDRPQIAATASKRGLQNPDWLIVGKDGDRTIIQAIDAKFSVETARTKQVSALAVQDLFALGSLIHDLIGPVGDDPVFVEGLFLCPDSPLTTWMMRQRFGIVRTTVRPAQVLTCAVDPAAFFGPMVGSTLMPELAAIDGLTEHLPENLLVDLYYFRLARAAIGLWLESTGSLLYRSFVQAIDEVAIAEEIERRCGQARTAIQLVVDWNEDNEHVRRARSAIDQVAGLPISSRALKELFEQATVDLEQAPSMNQVRRRVGSWYRAELQAQLGDVRAPVGDLPHLLNQIAAIGSSLRPQVRVETERIIAALIGEMDQKAKPAG